MKLKLAWLFYAVINKNLLLTLSNGLFEKIFPLFIRTQYNGINKCKQNTMYDRDLICQSWHHIQMSIHRNPNEQSFVGHKHRCFILFLSFSVFSIYLVFNWNYSETKFYLKYDFKLGHVTDLMGAFWRVKEFPEWRKSLTANHMFM